MTRVFDTLRIGEASDPGWSLELRLVRERESGTHHLVYGGEAHGPFATEDDALAECARSFGSPAWRSSLTLAEGEAPCPVCGAPLARSARYPRALCPPCVLEAIDREGRRVRFANESISGGFVAHPVGGEPSQDHDCWVRGSACRADESYFGGIVVQRVDG